MTSLKILQYNTDNLRHGWEYFKRNLEKSDLAVLQRFPKNKKPQLTELMSGCRTYMLESCPPLDLCLAIARNKNVSSFGGVESITLPSAQHVMALGISSQGCTALKTSIAGVNIVSFLPCYEVSGVEYPIGFADTKIDVRFLLEKLKDEPSIIIGDFHTSPDNSEMNRIIENNGFKSYLDDYKTFRNIERGNQFFNLDKCISNTNISLSNINVDVIKETSGHMAITYTIHINK